MRKILFFIFSLLSTVAFAADQQTMQNAKFLQSPHHAAFVEAVKKQDPHRVYGEWPEGDYRDYMLASYVTIYDEAIFTSDQVTQMCFGDDGCIYFESFFPIFYHNLWIKGVQNGDMVEVDCEPIVFSFDPDGTGEPYEYHVGEIYIDDNGQAGYRNAKFKREGDKFTYVPGDAFSELALFEIWDGEVWVETTTWDATWTPLTDEVVTVPETAVKTDYISYNEDLNKNKYARKGWVAVDGNDYYFNSLCSAEGIVKGTRSGNKITVKANQYIGTDGSYFLYEGGYKTDFIIDGNYELIGEASDIVFNIDSTGKISIAQPGSYMMVVLTPEGKIYDCSKKLTLEPYAGDAPAVPSDASNLAITDRTGTYDNAYYFEYSLNNLDVNGKYMNPEKLGYYLYLDDEIYTFTPEIFHYIDGSMTLVPWGYSDRSAYDVIWNGGDCVLWLYEYDFEMLGIQVVYDVDGVENLSNVISCDLDNNIIVNFGGGKPEAVDHLNVQQPVANPSWYDLNGRRMAGAAQHGVYVVDGKKIVIK